MQSDQGCKTVQKKKKNKKTGIYLQKQFSQNATFKC